MGTTTTMQAIVLLLSVTAFVTDAQTPVPVEGQATEQQNPPDPLGGEGTGVTGEGGEPAAVDAIGPGIGQGEMPRPEREGTGVTDEGGVAPVGMKKIVAGEDGAVGAKAAGSEPTAVPADGGTGGGEARGAEPSEAQLADASVNPIPDTMPQTLAATQGPAPFTREQFIVGASAIPDAEKTVVQPTPTPTAFAAANSVCDVLANTQIQGYDLWPSTGGNYYKIITSSSRDCCVACASLQWNQIHGSDQMKHGPCDYAQFNAGNGECFLKNSLERQCIPRQPSTFSEGIAVKWTWAEAGDCT